MIQQHSRPLVVLLALTLAGCSSSSPDGALKSILSDMEAMAVILEQDEASFQSSRAALGQHHKHARDTYKQLANPKQLSYEEQQRLFERHREETDRVAMRLLKAAVARNYSVVDLPGLGRAGIRLQESGELQKIMKNTAKSR